MLYLLILFFVLFVWALGLIWSSHGNIALHPFDLKETMPLRGILAIGVWLTHLCPYLDRDAPILTDFCLWGPPSVACFFLLAGYGLAVSYEKSGESYLNGFFRRRLLRLIWPWLIMIVIYQGWRFVQGSFSLSKMLEEPSPMSWFLYALLIWYVIFYLSFRCSTKTCRLIVLWSLAMVYLAVTIHYGMGYYWMSILPMPIIMSLVPIEKQIKGFITRHPYMVWIGVFILTMSVLTYATFGQFGYSLPVWGPPVYTVLPFSVLLLTYILGGSRSRVLNFLGSISYEFYIVHGLIVMLFHKDCLFGLQGVCNVILTLLLNLLFVIIAASLMNMASSFVYSLKKN